MLYLRRFALPVVCLIAFGTPTGAALAQELPNAGYVAGTAEVLSSTDLGDGRVARRMFFSVTVIPDDPDNPFGNASQDCFATYIFEEDGSPVGGRGACDAITVTGDVWWISLELQPDGSVHWEHVGGTGTLAGLSSSGTTTGLAEFQDGKVLARYEGTRSP
jgi:hypothetical protein